MTLGLSLLAAAAEVVSNRINGPVRKPLPPTVPPDARPSLEMLEITVWRHEDVKLPTTKTRSASNAQHWELP